MKRIHIVGLCLAAVFAFSAMVASSASAAEYGICTGTSLTTGKALKNQEWKDPNCTQKEMASDPDGKYAWVPGPPLICYGGSRKTKTIPRTPAPLDKKKNLTLTVNGKRTVAKNLGPEGPSVQRRRIATPTPPKPVKPC